MLPAVRTNEEWEAVVWNESLIRPAAEDLAARLGLAAAELRRYPGGSRPVYAAGNRRVLKLYPTVSAPDSVTEAHVLAYLTGKLPVAIPSSSLTASTKTAGTTYSCHSSPAPN